MARQPSCSHCRSRRGASWRLLRLVIVLLGLGWLIKRCLRRQPASDAGTMTIPSWAYRRPDPLIYSQSYLSSLGYAVTWDNPDITVERGGTTVDQHNLAPATEYDVVVRVWNGSTSGPAVDLPVRVSYLDFGIGTVSVPVGVAAVDLPVKGAPGSPAFARVSWLTPSTPGHYCLQAFLDWADDANPANNLGQSNTDVRALNSPHATFEFPVRNDGPRLVDLRLEADAYVIPTPEHCDEPPKQSTVRDRHGRGGHQIPQDWLLDIAPTEVRLRPGERVDVSVVVTAPEGFVGRKTFNINAFEGVALRGGVTLTAEGAA